MKQIDPELFDDLFDLARDVCQRAHVMYGVELTVSEVMTSVFVEQEYNEEATVGRLHVLLYDADEMQSWLKKMAVTPVRTRREYRRRMAMRIGTFLMFIFMAMVLLWIIGLGGPLAISGIIALGVLGAAFGGLLWEVIIGRTKF